MTTLRLHIFLFTALLCGGLAARADEFDTLRLKWRDSLTQGTNVNPADPLYGRWIAGISNSAQRAWSTMATNASRTFLWSDLNHLSTVSFDITATYSRLRAMAMGHAVRGSGYESNSALRAVLLSGLDWMYANHYHEGVVNLYDNWFDWLIGTPLLLNDITVLMYSNLSAARVNNYMNAVDRFTPVPDLTGANLVWQASVVGVRGAIVKSGAKLASARDALSSVFPYVNSGDGFYTDGAFVFHDIFPYTGGYGTELIGTLGPLMQFLSGSTWQVTNPAQTNVFRWVRDSFDPLIYRGAMMQMVSGRYFTRDGDDHVAGHDAIAAILRLAQFAPPADAAVFNSMVKGWLVADTSRDFIGTQPPPYNIWAQGLMNASNVPAREEIVGHFQFPRMDRVVHLRPGWGFGLAMSSSRIGNYESTRGENLRGWYTGEGMTYLYGPDLNQYADGFWPAIDPYRLPGTTVDGTTRTNGSGEAYLSPNNWAGGASLGGQYGVAGMHMNAWNSVLSARKSWFMFDNEIVCLGAGISTTNNRAVETIVENRRLACYGNNAFTVNDVSKPNNPGWAENMPEVSWTHLAGNAPGADVGYYFPQATAVRAVREARVGSLYDLNTTYGSTNLVARNFFTLTLDHGVAPSNGVYSYVLLPNHTVDQVAAYAASPDIVVLENTTRGQAVKENTLGITAINFWRDGSNRVAGISSDRKASVILRNDGATLVVGLADPTQANSDFINLEIPVSASAVLAADPAVSVVQLSPVIKLSVSVGGLAGRTVSAQFFVGPVQTVTLAPAIDAHVQNGDQADVNFGSAGSLGVKASGASLARETFLRFDLAGAPGMLFGATLRLVPNTVEFPLNHALASVPDVTWMESGITWNNKPSSNPEFTRWLMPAAGTPVLTPILPLVAQAAAGNGKLSLRVSSTGTPTPTNGGYSSYASRENGASGNRPQLILSLGRIPPAVTVTSPVVGALFDAPASVTIAADAQDADGPIASVEFYSGITRLAQITTPPYSITWSNLGVGQYAVSALVTDQTGLTATSAPVVFTVHSAEPAGRGGGLLGEYYTSRNLTGIAYTRTDQTVNFFWSTNSPVATDRFSIRWTGRVQARRAGLHAFHTLSDEGVRIWLDGRMLIDNWTAHELTEDTATVSLIPGKYYDIQVEYYDDIGSAAMQLFWTQPGGVKEIIPQAQLYASDTGLRASYYASTNLTTLAFTRIDDTVNFAWGASSPDPALLPGPFSARWIGKVRAKQAGTYTFFTLSDDGVRFSVNGVLLINNWTTPTPTLKSNTIALAAGQAYSVLLDYFDNLGDATLVLMWAPPGEPMEVIPDTYLTPFQNNNPPALAPIQNMAGTRGDLLAFSAAASDPEAPHQSLTFSLDSGAPAGASIDPTNGTFTWIPSPALPVGDYMLTARVIDNGIPAMTDAQTFTVTLVSNAQTAPVILISTGSVWRYLDSGIDPGTSWRGIGFNDGAWNGGAAPLGYGGGGQSTVVRFGPNPANKYITTYFRKSFYVPEPAFVQNISARLLRDDGVILYLNGTEIWRDNMPAGIISNTTTALTPAPPAARTNFITRALNPTLLVTGANVIAAEIHQAAADGPDILFDCELAGMAVVPSPTILGILPSTNGVSLTWPAGAALFRLFTATNLSPPAVWLAATNVPVLSGGQWTVVLPTGADQTRFYRLQTP